MQSSSYPDVDALLDQLHVRIRGILGSKLVGLYTFGSLATGAFEYEISDIDLVAALTADLDGQEFTRLERMHSAIAASHPRWYDRIEVGYIALPKLRRIEPDATIALISPGEPFHRKQAGNDWLFNLATLRERGWTRCGPPPQTLIDPIQPEDLVARLPPLMCEWRAWIGQTELTHRRKYQGHMIITMCRSLYLFRRGEVVSKRQATDWAEWELPQWAPLIRDALAWRAAPEDGNGDATLAQTLQFVHLVIDTILDE